MGVKTYSRCYDAQNLIILKQNDDSRSNQTVIKTHIKQTSAGKYDLKLIAIKFQVDISVLAWTVGEYGL